MSRDYRPVYTHDGGLRVELQASDDTAADGTARRMHRLVTGSGRGAVAVGLRNGDTGEEILFVSSWRDAAGGQLLELPRGWAEPADETTDQPFAAAALRELFEETGHRASGPEVLGQFVLDSSVYPQRVGVVRCRVDGAPQGAPDGEIDGMTWVDRSRIDGLVRDGTIADGLTLAALAMLDAAERTNGDPEGRRT